MSFTKSFKGYLPHTAFVMTKHVEPSTQAYLSAAASVVPTAHLIFIESSKSGTSAQELLSKMIDAMALKRNQVWVTDYAAFREHEPEISNRVMVALGGDVARKILQSEVPIPSLRSKVHQLSSLNRLIVSFHPNELLQNPQLKKEAWEDLKMAMRELAASEE